MQRKTKQNIKISYPLFKINQIINTFPKCMYTTYYFSKGISNPQHKRTRGNGIIIFFRDETLPLISSFFEGFWYIFTYKWKK